MYIHFEGIPGECKDKGFEKYSVVLGYRIQTSSVSGEIALQNGQQGQTSAKPNISGLEVLLQPDTTTPDLWLRLLEGDPIKKVRFVVANQATKKRVNLIEWELEEVTIVDFKEEGRGTTLTENVVLNFNRFKRTHRTLNNDENNVSGWDLGKNEKL